MASLIKKLKKEFLIIMSLNASESTESLELLNNTILALLIKSLKPVKRNPPLLPKKLPLPV